MRSRGALRYASAVLSPSADVKAIASGLGLDRVAVTRADVSLDLDFGRYTQFVQQGMHGTMHWLAKYGDVRRSLAHEGILPGAKSVICVAQRYASPGSGATGVLPHIARYARGRDYHDHFRKLLRKLAAELRLMYPGSHSRPMVDTAPVLERAWAARAGLGFIGKNGLLIIPGMGSFVVLGEVVTDVDLAPDLAEGLAVTRCGRCTRCLDACPTRAFAAPYVLDARRCISYLTIEHHGEFASDLADKVAPWLFGCDRCQEVCPFNRAPDAIAPDGSPFDPLPRWAGMQPEDLLTLSEAQWRELSSATPLRRVSLAEIQRNARLVARKPSGQNDGHRAHRSATGGE